MSEIALIFVIALVVIGPKQLPQVAKYLGRLAGDIKRATGEFNKEMAQSARQTSEEMQAIKNEIDKNLKSDPSETDTPKKENDV